MTSSTPHIPILRKGAPYRSVDVLTLCHHATGEPVATISQANGGLVARDMDSMNAAALNRFSVADLLAACRRAADLFMTADLPLGDGRQSFDDYVVQLSATTGLPHVLCRSNARKIHTVLTSMAGVLAGLSRGLDLSVLDQGHGRQHDIQLCFVRTTEVLGAVLPSNSPGVHSLWLPALPLKTPVALKPGREEPWTPYRLIQSFIAGGLPREAFGFYPGDHAAASELLRRCGRSLLFGDSSTTSPWRSDPRVELHGPGYSKVLLGNDQADRWRQHLDIIVDSILANGGRSCVNASAVWTPRHGLDLARALAERLAAVQPRPADDPQAQIAAFANPAMAERISDAIDAALAAGGAEDLTAAIRGSGRMVRGPRCAWLLPTVIWCPDRDHPLARREYLFPFAAVTECPAAEMADAIGPTLAVTALTADPQFVGDLMASPDVDRLNVGPLPTWQVSWDQPHEGNLLEHLYRRRSFRAEPVP
ncbi:MAG: hypothetical protein BIFFINMI_00876 [Phycisphaerae bacterium]|nr:hypothetical protein [Phycisphaerae bacterium]